MTNINLDWKQYLTMPLMRYCISFWWGDKIKVSKSRFSLIQGRKEKFEKSRKTFETWSEDLEIVPAENK